MSGYNGLIRVLFDSKGNDIRDKRVYYKDGQYKIKAVCDVCGTSLNCVKVTDHKGNWLYFNTDYFQYVQKHTENIYLTDDDRGTKILMGTFGAQCILVAPLETHSVEMYL